MVYSDNRTTGEYGQIVRILYYIHKERGFIDRRILKPVDEFPSKDVTLLRVGNSMYRVDGVKVFFDDDTNINSHIYTLTDYVRGENEFDIYEIIEDLYPNEIEEFDPATQTDYSTAYSLLGIKPKDKP